MPSPFPGMDPYLEFELWTTVHSMLAPMILLQLAPQIRPRYVALTTERFVVDSPDDVAIEESGIYPDVGMVRSRDRVGKQKTGRTTFLEAPLQLATIVPSKVPHVNIEIRDVRRRRLVTAIEILSPTNKRGRGRRQYLKKRRELLLSKVHILEIDLVRRGQRVPMRTPLPEKPYFVFLSRAE